MKFLLYAVLSLVLIVVLAGVIAYAIGSRLPVDHVTSVSGIVDAPPARTYALIANVAAGPTWRTGLQSVQMLPPVDGKDVWIETLDHNNKMNFQVLRADALSPDNQATRDVRLNQASYGGTWTYRISPGPTPQQTTLKITETGYINPPLYRFAMAHVFGMTRNLDQYMRDIQATALKP